MQDAVWALVLLSEIPQGVMAGMLHLAGGNLVLGRRHIFNIWMFRLTFYLFVGCSLLFSMALDLPNGTGG